MFNIIDIVNFISIHNPQLIKILVGQIISYCKSTSKLISYLNEHAPHILKPYYQAIDPNIQKYLDSSKKNISELSELIDKYGQEIIGEFEKIPIHDNEILPIVEDWIEMFLPMFELGGLEYDNYRYTVDPNLLILTFTGTYPISIREIEDYIIENNLSIDTNFELTEDLIIDFLKEYRGHDLDDCNMVFDITRIAKGDKQVIIDWKSYLNIPIIEIINFNREHLIPLSITQETIFEIVKNVLIDIGEEIDIITPYLSQEEIEKLKLSIICK
jgi:hypothetical protein